MLVTVDGNFRRMDNNISVRQFTSQLAQGATRVEQDINETD